MTDTPPKENTAGIEGQIDLSQLKGLSLGPAWGDANISSRQAIHKAAEGKSNRQQGGPRKDRRPQRPNFRDSGRPPRQEVTFTPTVQVDFYPDDNPFKALAKAVRHSGKTYQLFEIASVILEKPERFLVVVQPKTEDKALYYSMPAGIPFETEDQALAHVFKHYLDRFFDTEEVEAEPPKGSFPIINKCSITGEPIGPPNYHRYQQLLHEHYNNCLNHMSFEKFTAKIEAVNDKEAVDEWLAKMKKTTRYIFKEKQEGEDPKIFETWEEARFFLLSHYKNKLVDDRKSVRFSGKLIELMPNGPLRRSVEEALEQQRKFPLATANNLRGRFRRMKFNLYKRGSRGISYISAVKRKFRSPTQVFADSIQKLVTFIEKHPNINVVQLPSSYLGFDEGTKTEFHQEKTREQEELASVLDTPTLTEEQKVQSAQVMLDLKWLVNEGYVIEYGAGALFAEPPREPMPSKGHQKKEVSAKLKTDTAVWEGENARTKAESLLLQGVAKAAQEVSTDSEKADTDTTADNTGNALEKASSSEL